MAYHSGDQIIKRLSFETSGVCDFTNAKAVERITNKNANYQLTENDSGTIFTTYACADNATFALPRVPRAGLRFKIINCTANNVIVGLHANATSNSMISFADAAADTVTITDIGVTIEIIGTGNNWVVCAAGGGTANSIVVA